MFCFDFISSADEYKSGELFYVSSYWLENMGGGVGGLSATFRLLPDLALWQKPEQKEVVSIDFGAIPPWI